MAVEDLSRSLKNKGREDVPVLGTVLAQLSSAFSQGPTLGVSQTLKVVFGGFVCRRRLRGA